MQKTARPGGPPFRAEHVGSLLRPPELKAAYRGFSEQRIDAGELERILAKSIGDAIRLQEQAGMQAITDGEFRRGSWFLGFVDAVGGLSTKPSLFNFGGAHGAWECPYAHGPVRRKRGIATEEFAFVRARTRGTPKITLPTPSALLFWRGRDAADPAVYPSLDRLHSDLVDVYRAELKALADLGCTYVQLDEVPLAMLCDPKLRDTVTAHGQSATALIELYVDLINAVIDKRPPGLTVALHLCRGNYKGQWMAEGGYMPVAERLFGGAKVDAFFLEYDSERAGDFAPLGMVRDDAAVILGLISTKSAASPSADTLVKRIEAAAKFVPLDRLGESPQCGFASSVGGNPITVEDEKRKLALVSEVARRVWG